MSAHALPDETAGRSNENAAETALVIRKDGNVAIVTYHLGLGRGAVVEVDRDARTYAIRVGNVRPLLLRQANEASIGFLTEAGLTHVAVFEGNPTGTGFLYHDKVPVEHVRGL